jgi:acetoin:2,6-dichlorophenolindophenol oxidoreductase subunit alpha
MAEPDTALLIDSYTAMCRIRAFEEEAVRLFRNGELPGFIHPSVGQEAVPVGVCHHLDRDDMITSTHRGHGHLIAKGAPLAGMFGELMGLEGGLCRGRGGSMHIMDATVGILGANGIVGGGLPIAVGAGLASQQRGLDRVVVSFFGDGSVNTGSFHEALNLAAVWRLPVIFVCENNQYAESTAFESVLPTADLGPRAASYGMPGEVIDGNDLLDVLRAAGDAVRRARAGDGPTLIQADTYRWYGHHTGDVAPYRDPEELESWKARDPIARLAALIARRGPVARRRLAGLEEAVSQEIREAVEVARGYPPPDPATVTRDVYAREARGVLA